MKTKVSESNIDDRAETSKPYLGGSQKNRRKWRPYASQVVKRNCQAVCFCWKESYCTTSLIHPLISGLSKTGLTVYVLCIAIHSSQTVDALMILVWRVQHHCPWCDHKSVQISGLMQKTGSFMAAVGMRPLSLTGCWLWLRWLVVGLLTDLTVVAEVWVWALACPQFCQLLDSLLARGSELYRPALHFVTVHAQAEVLSAPRALSTEHVFHLYQS
jgi:hypothetical protein